MLRIFTAREQGEFDLSEIVGYNCFFVNPNLHYRSSLQAVQDVIFVEQSKRGKGIGKEFINWCDMQLKAEGVQVVYHHIKAKHNFGLMLESLGYTLVDLIYSRRLDQAVE